MCLLRPLVFSARLKSVEPPPRINASCPHPVSCGPLLSPPILYPSVARGAERRCARFSKRAFSRPTTGLRSPRQPSAGICGVSPHSFLSGASFADRWPV